MKAPSADAIKREIDAMQALGAAHLAAREPDYSACLAAIDAPPPGAHRARPLRPAEHALDRHGRRARCIRSGTANGARTRADPGQAGYVVVSGMARGVDGEAHLGGTASRAV